MIDTSFHRQSSVHLPWKIRQCTSRRSICKSSRAHWVLSIWIRSERRGNYSILFSPFYRWHLWHKRELSQTILSCWCFGKDCCDCCRYSLFLRLVFGTSSPRVDVAARMHRQIFPFSGQSHSPDTGVKLLGMLSRRATPIAAVSFPVDETPSYCLKQYSVLLWPKIRGDLFTDYQFRYLLENLFTIDHSSLGSFVGMNCVRGMPKSIEFALIRHQPTLLYEVLFWLLLPPKRTTLKQNSTQSKTKKLKMTSAEITLTQYMISTSSRVRLEKYDQKRILWGKTQNRFVPEK